MNTRGKQVSERLSLLDGPMAAFRKDPDIDRWFEDGTAFRGELEAAMHGELDAGSVEERPIREWQAEGRHIERYIYGRFAEVARWGKEQGWSEEETAKRLAEGVVPPAP